MSNAIWHLEANLAKLAVASQAVSQIASLAATIDLTHPAMGLHNLAINGQQFESTRIFQLSPPQMNLSQVSPSQSHPLRANAREIEDCYGRGRDLIVTYAPSKEYPLRTQLIWRASGIDALSASAGSVELILSVETDTLGTDPQLCVESTFAAQQTLRYVDSAQETFASPDADACDAPASNGYLIHIANTPDRIAHFIHPDDYRGGGLSPQQTPQSTNCRISHPLFAGDLEKGVILRGRMAAFFFSSDETTEDNEMEIAITAYRQFIAQPLPLGT